MSTNPTLFDYYNIQKPVIKKLDGGFIYKGSKRKIAKDILEIIREYTPNATHFYDLFGGGGAMSFNASYNGYKTYYNELDKDVFLLIDFVIDRLKNNKSGKYGILPDEYYKFISKEEFDKIRANTIPSAYRGFVLLNYSFGNELTNYFCAKEKEIFKEKGHYLILENNKEYAEWWDTYFVENGSVGGIYMHLHNNIYPSIDWRERRKYFVNITLKLEAIRVAKIGHLFNNGSNADRYELLYNMPRKELCRIIERENPHLPKKNYERSINRLERLQQLQRLEQLEQLQQLERLEQLQQLEFIGTSNLDYQEVKITSKPKDTIIYCDPPYKNTSIYKINNNNFDYERFYNYMCDLAKQGYNVFISEYNMPSDRFKEILSKEAIANFMTSKKECGASIILRRIEKLFMPIV